MREKLSKIFGSNAFYIAISVLIALLLWLDVAYFRNETITVDIYNVPVNVVGEAELEDKGLIATSISKTKIDLKISGRPSDVTRISHKEVYVTVDLEDITSISSGVGAYQLLYSVTYPSNVNANYLTVESASVDYITVRVENYITKQVPIRAEYNVTVPEGFTAEPIQIKQESVMISGPESVLNRISYALVTVNQAQITDTYSSELPFSYRSDDDEIVTSDLIKTTTDSVQVTIPVLLTKEVPLILQLTGFNSATEDNCSVTIDPASVKISGSPTRISSIEKIDIATVDLKSFVKDYENVYNIVLPADVTNISEIDKVSVKVTISGLATREITASSFEIINNKTGREANITTESVTMTLRGKNELLDSINPENIIIQADLGNLKDASGTYSVPAVIIISGVDGVDAVGTYTVTVTI